MRRVVPTRQSTMPADESFDAHTDPLLMDSDVCLHVASLWPIAVRVLIESREFRPHVIGP